MTPQQATKILGLVVTAKAAGNSWAQIARHNGFSSPQAAKKAAKQAAQITQQFLLSQKETR